MKFFQYWNTGQPPDEVAAWIEGFRVMNPGLRHRLYDRDRASWFIRKRLGARYQKAFEACAVPSMQSNVFRLSAVLAMGGVYADADLQCLDRLKTLLARAPHAMMLEWNGAMTHSFMMFRQPGDPFLAACLKLVTENIEAGRFDTSYMSTGPAIPNAIRTAIDPTWRAGQDGAETEWGELIALARSSLIEPAKVAESIAALSLVHVLATERWLGTAQPAYKSTGVHWLSWKGSIYQDVASPDPGPETLQA